MHCELKILDPRITALEYATTGAAAVDLRACTIDGLHLDRPVVLAPGARAKIGTGIALDLDSMTLEHKPLPALQMESPCHEDLYAFSAYAAKILPRSGLGSRGVVLGNLVGLIDGDYQGEVTLALWNAGADELRIEPLDRLAQMVIVPVARPRFRVVDTFSRESARGANGFGHSGVK